MARAAAAGGVPGRLFTDGERESLAQALAAVRGTAELLGRARVAGAAPAAYAEHRDYAGRAKGERFTGEIKDALGRRVCFEDGRRVGCQREPKPAKAARPTVADTLAHVRGLLADPSKLTPGAVKALAARLQGHTVKELAGIKGQLGLKASGGTKGALAQKIAERALAATKPAGAKPPPAPPKSPPAPPKSPPEAVKPPAPVEPPAPARDFPQQDPNHPVAKAIREDRESRAVVDALAAADGLPEAKAYHDALGRKEEAERLGKEYDRLRDEKGKRHPDTRAAVEAWSRADRRAPAGHEIDRLREKYREAARRVLRENLRPAEPARIGTEGYPGLKNPADEATWKRIGMTTPYRSYLRDPYEPTAEEKDAVGRAAAFVGSLTDGRGLETAVQIARSPTGRASYGQSDAQRPRELRFARLLLGSAEAYKQPTINMGLHFSQEDRVVTTVHEFGHHVEESKPGAREAAHAFLEYRIGGEKAVDMATVPGGEKMAGEMVRRDSFDRAFEGTSAYYVGRDYRDAAGRRFGTEITSMGLQALYQDPVRFAQKDPEYAAFVVRQLRGR